MAVILRMTVVTPLVFLLLPRGASSVAITAQAGDQSIRGRGAAVVRRESSSLSVQTDTSGHLLREKPMVESGPQECKIAYDWGNEDANTCQQASHHLIYEKGLCKVGGAEAGLAPGYDFNTNLSNFEVTGTWMQERPKGCFKGPCSDANGTASPVGCVFYNKDGNLPPNPIGTPLCQKPRYANGTELGTASTTPAVSGLIQLSNDTTVNPTPAPTDAATAANATAAAATYHAAGNAHVCPQGYELIHTWEHCESAGSCLGRNTGSEENNPLDPMNVQQIDAANGKNYPQGCFIDTSSAKFGIVYFNPIKADYAPFATAQGVPLCKAPHSVTHKTWPAGPENTVTVATTAADDTTVNTAADDTTVNTAADDTTVNAAANDTTHR